MSPLSQSRLLRTRARTTSVTAAMSASLVRVVMYGPLPTSLIADDP